MHHHHHRHHYDTDDDADVGEADDDKGEDEDSRNEHIFLSRIKTPWEALKRNVLESFLLFGILPLKLD